MEGCEALPDVRAGQPVVAGMFLYGAGVNGRLDLAHGRLELDKLGVSIMVPLDLGFQTPVSVFANLVHDEGEWSGVGRDALEEPSGDNVGGCVAGDGRESLQLVGVDSVIRAPQGALDSAGTGDAFDVARQESDAV